MSIQQDIINHTAYIRRMRDAGGAAVQAAHSDAPPVDVGLFDYPLWAAGVQYQPGDLFTYNGQAGFVRSAHTSAEVWLPFSAGTESLYGARPRQRPDGVYPYVYNMRADKGMIVESSNGKTYLCTRDIDPLLYDPADVPAHFEPI